MTDQEKPAEETTGGADHAETFTDAQPEAAQTTHPPHPLQEKTGDSGPMPEYREEPSYLLLKQKRCFGRVVFPEILMENMNPQMWHAMTGLGFIVRCEYLVHVPGYEIIALSSQFAVGAEVNDIPSYVATIDSVNGFVSYERVLL